MPKPPIEPGMVIKASDVNAGIGAANFLENLRVAPPLEMVRLKHGWIIRLAMTIFQVRLGVTSGGITGGSTGSGTASPGSGTVTVYKITSGSGALATTPQTVTVYNVFSAAISSGKNVIIVRVGGLWWLLGADC